MRRTRPKTMARVLARALLPAAALGLIPIHAQAADSPSVAPHVPEETGAAGAPQPAAAFSPSGPDLTLEECFQLAVSRNERIGTAVESYLQAELLKKTARSRILPQISLEDTYYRQNNVTLVSGGSAAPPSQTSSTFTTSDERNETLIKLTQPIFSGFRDRNFIRFASDTVDAFRHGLDDAGRQLYQDVAAAFFTVLGFESEVHTLRDAVGVESARLREITARRDVGLARKTDVLLAQSQLSEDESRLTESSNAVLVSRQVLAFLAGATMDRPLKDDITIPEEFLGAAPPSAVPSPDQARPEETRDSGVSGHPAAPPGSNAAAAWNAAQGAPADAEMLDAIRADAFERRSDLKQLESTVMALGHQVSVVRGEYSPSFSLEANYILNRWNYAPFQKETDWTAEVTASLPLFTGGRIRADVATAQSALQQAILARDAARRRIELEIRSVWSTLQSDLARLTTIESRVATAEENFRLIQEEYRNGIATNLEVLAAQNQLLSARIDLERQRYRSKIDWLALEVVRGRLPSEPVSVQPPQSSGSQAESAPSGADDPEEVR